MSEFLRLVLLLGLAGAAVTFIVAVCAWFMAEERRLGRAFRNVLGEQPDTTLVAHGRGRAAAFSFATGRIAVAWNAGGWCLVYGLEELLGAELTLDGDVAGRVMRGEPRRALDRMSGAEDEVRLRLLFDDALHPDFELILWPPATSRAGAPGRASEAISEANRWLARIEAVLRRTGTAVIRPDPASPAPRAARPPPPPHADLFEDEDEDEADLI
ncbi:MAG: hypothetical protein ACHP7N_17595 [Caulobacterales bacterium]